MRRRRSKLQRQVAEAMRAATNGSNKWQKRVAERRSRSKEWNWVAEVRSRSEEQKIERVAEARSSRSE
jgi:hypothetical protein